MINQRGSMVAVAIRNMKLIPGVVWADNTDVKAKVWGDISCALTGESSASPSDKNDIADTSRVQLRSASGPLGPC